MPLDINTNVITSGTVKMFNDTSIQLTGLTYMHDAALGNSYPGSGTSWPEWVSNGTTGTLTNGPTPSNDGGGSILFDGSNDYVDIPTRTINPPFTVQMWIKPNSSGGGLHSHWSGGPVNHGLYIESGKLALAYYNSTWRYAYDNGVALGTGTWRNVALSVTGSGSTSAYFWVDGQLSSIQTITGGIYGLNWGSLGILWGFNYLNGNIAQCLNYSGTNIGSSGIYSNYQATRARFGV